MKGSSFLQAVGAMLLSTMSFAVMNIIVKYLHDFGGHQLVFFRSLGSLMISMPLLRIQSIPMWGNNIRLLVLRGLAGVTSMFLFFSSIKYIPVGTATTLRYVAPIFAAILAVLVWKEKIRPLQWLFFLMSFVGIFIIKGFDAELQLLGVFMAIVSAFFTAMVFLIIQKIGSTEHSLVIVNYFMLIATAVGGIVCLFDWKQPTAMEWVWLLVLGVFGFFGQLFMTKAFQLANASSIAPFKYIEVVFVIGIGGWLLEESYPWFTILGILFVILGLLLNIWYKTRYLS
ncbi:MAG: DMT family transporter [Flavobacteriaceae bacterium]|nr:DMT family transporter [Flavobacteriaceae bacterium]